jgi:hypothetical protein
MTSFFALACLSAINRSRDALLRYPTGRDLATRARRAPFSVQAVGSALIITPGSGLHRRITQAQFERSLPLIVQDALRSRK